MHVLIINHHAVSPDQSGGTRHFALARELVRRGHEATILASAQHYQGAEGRDMAAKDVESTIDGVRFVKLATFGNQRSTAGRFLAMLDFARSTLKNSTMRRVGQPDVVYGSSPHLFAALAALRLARRERVPFVLEIRDIWPESIVELGGVSRHHPVILAMAAIERALYRGAEEVVTLLPNSGEHIRQVAGREVRLTVIPNLVDVDLHATVTPPDAAAPFTLLYAGAHGLANALDTLVDAATLARDDSRLSLVRFYLLGAGPEKERLQARVARLGLANVVFGDAVPKREVGAKLAEASAFYMPLKDSKVFKQGISPNKLYDYMAAARPIVFAVDTPCNPVAECNAGITIPPEDPNALFAAVATLSDLSAEERRGMGERARAYVLANHTASMMADRLLEVLCRVRANDRGA
jgi:glycosyltransferase involved in cell wall biosynthesis